MKFKGVLAGVIVICIGGVAAWGIGTALRKANEGHGLRCPFDDKNPQAVGALKTPATCTSKAVYYYSCPKCKAIDESRTFEYGDYAHTFDKEVATDEYKAGEANCTHKATYYKSCECGAKGTETFEVGELGNHSFEQGVCIHCGEDE